MIRQLIYWDIYVSVYVGMRSCVYVGMCLNTMYLCAIVWRPYGQYDGVYC